MKNDVEHVLSHKPQIVNPIMDDELLTHCGDRHMCIRLYMKKYLLLTNDPDWLL